MKRFGGFSIFWQILIDFLIMAFVLAGLMATANYLGSCKITEVALPMRIAFSECEKSVLGLIARVHGYSYSQERLDTKKEFDEIISQLEVLKKRYWKFMAKEETELLKQLDESQEKLRKLGMTIFTLIDSLPDKQTISPEILAKYEELDMLEAKFRGIIDKTITKSEEDVAQAKNLMIHGNFLAGVVGIILVMILSIITAGNIARPIRRLTKIADELSREGDLKQEDDTEEQGLLNEAAYSQTNNEVRRLSISFSRLIRSLREFAQQAQAIASGDLTIDIKVRSEKDVFGNAFKSMVESLRRMSVIAGKIAEGDLQQRVEPKSEKDVFGNAFKSMIEGLKKIVGTMLSTAQQVSTSSQQQAAGASEQSSAISETTSAAVELSKNAEQIGESIKRVALVTNHAMAGMAKIKDAIGKTGEKITLLSEKSQEIGKITDLIKDVADQTNLLAVNAAIEAARAGEQGRGFTVVADEIRKLSDSTAKSTKDITALIEIIQHEMSNAILSMEQSIAHVNEEVKLSQESAESAKEISMSATQQISGSKQIADAISNINEAMKQISSGAQEAQAAARQLTALASEFKVAAIE